MLACGIPDAVRPGTGRPSKPAAEGPGGKNFGSGRSLVRPWRRTIGWPRRTFWQTVRRLRRGKQYSANTVYSAGGELLTSTGDIVGRWKKYFEDLLNPTDLPSNEEAEAGDSEVDSSITQAEVTEVVQSSTCQWQQVPGVDEIHPEYLKSLDVVGLSWLTRLCNIAWRLGTVGPPNLRPWFSTGKKGGVPSPGGWRGPASSGGVQVSRVRERWSVRLTGRLVQRPQSYADRCTGPTW
ncbi:hypothetical protein L3Q82_002978 [Scortum barcoo]|uniref:Uncharacterized protein n=1 Tax=Scortum barcoo TaxID=214431 RepID=A0ACB8VRM1_9TELE|nr:hypothetical protein L3Q82_002978 [Scortum barcoo]